MINIPNRYDLLWKMVDVCFQVIPEGLLLHGGQTSQYFVDVPLILQHPEYVESLLIQMYNLLRADELYTKDTQGVNFISIDTGGSVIAAAFQSFLSFTHSTDIPLFRVDKTGKIDDIPSIRQKTFILVDDVITTGKSLLPLVKHIKDQGGTILQAVTVVNRSAEGAGFGDRLLAEQGVPLSSVFTLEECILMYAVRRVNEKNG